MQGIYKFFREQKSVRELEIHKGINFFRVKRKVFDQAFPLEPILLELRFQASLNH